MPKFSDTKLNRRFIILKIYGDGLICCDLMDGIFIMGKDYFEKWCE